MFDVTNLVQEHFFDILPLPKDITIKILQFNYCEPSYKQELIDIYRLHASYTLMKSLYLCIPINKIVGNGKYNEAFFHKIQKFKNKMDILDTKKLQNMVSICIDEANYEYLYKCRIEYMDYLDIVHSYNEEFSNYYEGQYTILNTLRNIKWEYNEAYLDSLLIQNGVYLDKLACMCHRDKYLLYMRL